MNQVPSSSTFNSDDKSSLWFAWILQRIMYLFDLDKQHCKRTNFKTIVVLAAKYSQPPLADTSLYHRPNYYKLYCNVSLLRYCRHFVRSTLFYCRHNGYLGSIFLQVQHDSKLILLAPRYSGLSLLRALTDSPQGVHNRRVDCSSCFKLI